MITYFLALNLALAASKLLLHFNLAANKTDSYFLQDLTSEIFFAKLTYKLMISLANYSFLLYNFLLSSYNIFLTVA